MNVSHGGRGTDVSQATEIVSHVAERLEVQLDAASEKRASATSQRIVWRLPNEWPLSRRGHGAAGGRAKVGADVRTNQERWRPRSAYSGGFCGRPGSDHQLDQHPDPRAEQRERHEE